MKKNILFVCLISILFFGLVGCKHQETNDSEFVTFKISALFPSRSANPDENEMRELYSNLSFDLEYYYLPEDESYSQYLSTLGENLRYNADNGEFYTEDDESIEFTVYRSKCHLKLVGYTSVQDETTGETVKIPVVSDTQSLLIDDDFDGYVSFYLKSVQNTNGNFNLEVVFPYVEGSEEGIDYFIEYEKKSISYINSNIWASEDETDYWGDVEPTVEFSEEKMIYRWNFELKPGLYKVNYKGFFYYIDNDGEEIEIPFTLNDSYVKIESYLDTNVAVNLIPDSQEYPEEQDRKLLLAIGSGDLSVYEGLYDLTLLQDDWNDFVYSINLSGENNYIPIPLNNNKYFAGWYYDKDYTKPADETLCFYSEEEDSYVIVGYLQESNCCRINSIFAGATPILYAKWNNPFVAKVILEKDSDKNFLCSENPLENVEQAITVLDVDYIPEWNEEEGVWDLLLGDHSPVANCKPSIQVLDNGNLLFILNDVNDRYHFGNICIRSDDDSIKSNVDGLNIVLYNGSLVRSDDEDQRPCYSINEDFSVSGEIRDENNPFGIYEADLIYNLVFEPNTYSVGYMYYDAQSKYFRNLDYNLIQNYTYGDSIPLETFEGRIFENYYHIAGWTNQIGSSTTPTSSRELYSSRVNNGLTAVLYEAGEEVTDKLFGNLIFYAVYDHNGYENLQPYYEEEGEEGEEKLLSTENSGSEENVIPFGTTIKFKPYITAYDGTVLSDDSVVFDYNNELSSHYYQYCYVDTYYGSESEMVTVEFEDLLNGILCNIELKDVMKKGTTEIFEPNAVRIVIPAENFTAYREENEFEYPLEIKDMTVEIKYEPEEKGFVLVKPELSEDNLYVIMSYKEEYEVGYYKGIFTLSPISQSGKQYIGFTWYVNNELISADSFTELYEYYVDEYGNLIYTYNQSTDQISQLAANEDYILVIGLLPDGDMDSMSFQLPLKEIN